MRTLLAIGVASMVICPAASAAIPVDVRIEGAARTVFEGPVASDVRQVQASSDGALRTCDGTNNGANPTAGPTATTVAADALGLQGQSFDGTWYHGYEDYLISRLGPESSNGWGVYRNEQRSGLGGCQVAARAGDRILWAAGTGGGTTGVLRIALTGANPYTATVTDQTGAPVAGATIYDANAGGALASTGSVTGAAGTATRPARRGLPPAQGRQGRLRAVRPGGGVRRALRRSAGGRGQAHGAPGRHDGRSRVAGRVRAHRLPARADRGGLAADADGGGHAVLEARVRRPVHAHARLPHQGAGKHRNVVGAAPARQAAPTRCGSPGPTGCCGQARPTSAVCSCPSTTGPRPSGARAPGASCGRRRPGRAPSCAGAVAPG